MAVEKIQYQAGSVTGHGALVWNEKVSGKRPLLLVMPNWLGVTDIVVKRAAKMAGDNYIAFVADMYGNGKTSEGPPESQELMMAVRKDRVEGRKRVNAALNSLVAEANKRGIGDASRKAAVGFCFGGGNVLELARSGANWQMLDFGLRVHSFTEEETMMPGMAEYHAGAAHQTYRMLEDFIQDAFNKKL